MTEKEYFTLGCTALLDAVGSAIHHIERRRPASSSAVRRPVYRNDVMAMISSTSTPRKSVPPTRPASPYSR